MAKRFIKTDFLRNPWIRRAKPVHKILWLAILTECDHAGVWIVDWDMMTILCGGEVTEPEAREFLRGRFVEIDGGRRWFFPDFIRFQYPQGIFGNNNNLKSIRGILEKYGVCCENLTISTLAQPLTKTRPTLDQGLQEKEEEEYSIVEEYSNTPSTLYGNGEKNLGGSKNLQLAQPKFDLCKFVREFVTAYGKQGKIADVERRMVSAWGNVRARAAPNPITDEEIAAGMLNAAVWSRAHDKKAQTELRYRLNPETWLDQRQYEIDWETATNDMQLTQKERVAAFNDRTSTVPNDGL